LEAMLTENFRTDISYDWQKSGKRSGDIIDEEIQHRLTFTGNYSFARTLDLYFRSSKSMSSSWEGSTTLTNVGVSYSKDESHVSFRYNRASNPGRSLSLLGEKQWTTQTFILDFDQEVGQDADMSLSYESQLGRKQVGHREAKRISFRLNISF